MPYNERLPDLLISDPNVTLGKPVIMGTRITVEQILEKMAAGETVPELLENDFRCPASRNGRG